MKISVVALKQLIRESLKEMGMKEMSEEHPKHLGMGHHLHETIKLMVSEVLEEAKAKKYKGKSMRKGGVGRFAKLDDKLKASGKKRAAKK